MAMETVIMPAFAAVLRPVGLLLGVELDEYDAGGGGTTGSCGGWPGETPGREVELVGCVVVVGMAVDAGSGVRKGDVCATIDVVDEVWRVQF